MPILFQWSDEMKICDKIDRQHKKLIVIIKRLYDVFTQAKVQQELSDIMDELYAYTQYHFRTEEYLFKKCNYSHSQEYISEHRKFEQKIKEFAEYCKHDDLVLEYNTMSYLNTYFF